MKWRRDEEAEDQSGQGQEGLAVRLRLPCQGRDAGHPGNRVPVLRPVLAPEGKDDLLHEGLGGPAEGGEMKLVKLPDKRGEDVQATMAWALSEIENYDEVIIIGRVKGKDQYDAFPSEITSAFWWVGALEALKRHIMDDYLGEPEGE